MLYLNVHKSKYLVDVDEEFDKLRFDDIQCYMSTLKKYDAFVNIVNNPTSDMLLKHIVIRTCFGECMLTDISTSIKIIILALKAIKAKKRICFIAGELGDNFLVDLYSLCKDTDYVSLYQRDGIIPQRTVDIVLERR